MIPSLFVFLTLIYLEIGNHIVQEVPVRWKRKIDSQYLELCRNIKINRVERNFALDKAFKQTIRIFGLLAIVILLLFGGKNHFFLETGSYLILVLNLKFIFYNKRHFIKENLWMAFVMLILAVIAIIDFEFDSFESLDSSRLSWYKSWMGLFSGDQTYTNSSTFMISYGLLIFIFLIFGFLFRLSIGIINEVIYYLLSLIIRFSMFLGKEKAFGALLFMITSCSYIINAIWEYNK